MEFKHPLTPAAARAIVANPDQHPAMARQAAFAALKEARGQTVNFATLPLVRHRAPSAAPAESWPTTVPDAMSRLSPALRDRVRRRAAQLGHPLPTGGDAA